MKQAPSTGARLRRLSPERQRLLAVRLKLLPDPGDAKTDRHHLCAFVSHRRQAEGAQRLTVEDIREFLQDRLPSHMIPARINIREDLPFLPNGKLDRQSLLKLARSAEREERQEGEAVDSELMKSMRAIWSDVLDTREIYPDDNFFELGGDSLLSINVVSRARKQGVYLNPSELFDFPVLAELCAHLVAESAERAAAPEEFDRSPVRSKNVHGSSQPFFMVHGGSRLLNQLRDALGSEQPIHLIPAHWEHANLNYGVGMAALAEEALFRLQDIQPKGPYLLGGYSLGAVIAFEMAQMLIKSGNEVSLLFMLDPPEKPEDFASVWSEDELLAEVEGRPGRSRHLEELKNRSVVGKATYIVSKIWANLRHHASAASLEARFLYAQVCRFLGISIPQEIRKLYVFRAYMAASRTYDIQPLAAPILVFRATRGRHKRDPGIWRSVASGGLALHEFDCKHIDLQWNAEIVETWTALFRDQLQSLVGPDEQEAHGSSETSVTGKQEIGTEG